MSHPFLPELHRPLILASQSPRRRQLLEMQGLDFEVHVSEVVEAPEVGERPVAHALRLASAKARVVSDQYPEHVVLGGDTIVVVEDRILGKPADEEEAAEMLRQLGGRDHEVISAVALHCGAASFWRTDFDRTSVRFRSLEEEEILAYASCGEALDKAGAYGIQGVGALMVASIEGCYFNVMGLPLQCLRRLFWGFVKESSP